MTDGDDFDDDFDEDDEDFDEDADDDEEDDDDEDEDVETWQVCDRDQSAGFLCLLTSGDDVPRLAPNYQLS